MSLFYFTFVFCVSTLWLASGSACKLDTCRWPFGRIVPYPWWTCTSTILSRQKTSDKSTSASNTISRTRLSFSKSCRLVLHVFILFSQSFYFFFITLTLYLKCQFVSRAIRFKKKGKRMCENWWWIQAMPLLSPKSLLRRADCFVLLHIFRVDFFLFFSLSFCITSQPGGRWRKKPRRRTFFGFRISIEFSIFLSLVMCYNEKSLTLLSSPRISSFLFSFYF